MPCGVSPRAASHTCGESHVRRVTPCGELPRVPIGAVSRFGMGSDRATDPVHQRTSVVTRPRLPAIIFCSRATGVVTCDWAAVNRCCGGGALHVEGRMRLLVAFRGPRRVLCEKGLSHDGEGSWGAQPGSNSVALWSPARGAGRGSVGVADADPGDVGRGLRSPSALCQAGEQAASSECARRASRSGPAPARDP